MITKETNIPLYQYYSLNDYFTKENGCVLWNLFSLMFMTRNGNNWATEDISRRLPAALSPASDVRPKTGRQADPSPLGSDIISWPFIMCSLALSFIERAVDSFRTHDILASVVHEAKNPHGPTFSAPTPTFLRTIYKFCTHICLFILRSFD